MPSGGHPASPGGNAPLGRTQRTKKALTSGLFLAIIARLVVFAFALISGVFMIGVLFSFAVWVLTGQHAAFPSMLDFLVWGSLSFVPMALIQYYMDKLLNPDPKKIPDGRYELARLPANRDRHLPSISSRSYLFP